MLGRTWPVYGEDEVDAVVRVLRSGKVNYWTGAECREFEREFAAHCSVREAIAVANGTVALELALEALGIGPGDEVITTPRTFIASASAAVRLGARVRFADVDPDSQNITAETIKQALSPRTKAIVAVHLAGWPCDMDPIMELAAEHGFFVVEDCAQAHGAVYKGRPVGGIGHAGAFSFCQDKIISTGGEGGMITTNDASLWAKIWSLKDHGKDFETTRMPSDGTTFRWLHGSFGSNQRMTEMQAAIGRIQLRKLPAWNEQRRRNARVLAESLGGIAGFRIPMPGPLVEHAYYKFYAFVEQEANHRLPSRDELVKRLRAAGVACGSGSCSEIYLEKAFDKGEMRPPVRLAVARRLGESGVMFPVDPTFDERQMRNIGRVVQQVMASRAA